MATSPILFSIPSTSSLSELKIRLMERIPMREHKHGNFDLCYLDTFDGRLFKTGNIVETMVDAKESQLLWRSIKDGRIHAVLNADPLPRFAWDFPHSLVWAQLVSALGIRGLIPLITLSRQIHALSVLDKERKTIVQIDILVDSTDASDPEKSLRYIRLTPVRGYQKSSHRVERILRDEFSLFPLEQDPVYTCTTWFGRKLGATGTKRHKLAPGSRSDQTAKIIFLDLLHTIKDNEEGVREDWDTEFLHDFRVSIRKTRSLLSQLKQLFPTQRVERFKRDFAWLGKVTGPTRDLDVYLLDFDDYRKRLPEPNRDGLTALKDFLARRQKHEQKLLVTALDSARYARLVRDWEAFLTTAPPQQSGLANATRPIGDVARERIWKVYKRVLKEGQAINDASPHEDLHELRKTCKKLRYLIEAFRTLFPAAKIKELIKTLKILQDNLGEFQDLQVQQASLKGFEQAMQDEGILTQATEKAMDMLVEQMAVREHEVRTAFNERFRIFASSEHRRQFASVAHPRKAPKGRAA